MKRFADPVEVEKLLLQHYGRYREEPCREPLDELIWFLLSARTTVKLCERAFSALLERWPDYGALLAAPAAEVAAAIRCTGFSARRAESIQGTLARIRERFGLLTLKPLRKMSTADAETFLLTLPGVGIKVARCFLQFGLHLPAFAVDTHIWRISRRLGWLPGEKGLAPTRHGADALQEFVPKDDTVSLHVNLIFLGRDFCTAGKTLCSECPLCPVCPSAKKRHRSL